MTKEQEKNRLTDEMLFSYLNGTASFEEREWVKTWLEEHVDHRKKLEEYKDEGESKWQDAWQARWCC
jgi:hypothetical protein